MSETPTTPRQGTGNSRNGRKGKRNTDKKQSAGTGTNEKRLSSSSGNNESKSPSSPPSSCKKLKIFHYFGGTTTESPAVPTVDAATPRKSTPIAQQAPVIAVDQGGYGRNSCAIDRGSSGGKNKGDQGSAADARTVEGLLAPASSTSAAAPTPTWGKLVDPRKQRRWNLLSRLQEGGAVDPAAWARRSYSLGYVPVFQDGRTPGMGSTGSGTWGWASQSQVFGGARACLRPAETDTVSRKKAPVEEGETLDMEEDTAERNAKRGSGNSPGMSDHGVGGGVNVTKTNLRTLQARNFRIMHTWLSTSYTSPAQFESAPLSQSSCSSATVSWEGRKLDPVLPQTLLEVALARRDGGPAAVFMTLASMDPEIAGQMTDGPNPVALALRLYHGASTWRRISHRPAQRRMGQGRGSRLHPNDPGLAAAIDEAEAREREQRANADFESALALVNAGLAIPLSNAAPGSSGGWGSGQNSGNKREGDMLAVLAPIEALTATETRALAKGLGIAVSVAAISGLDNRRRGGGKTGTEAKVGDGVRAGGFGRNGSQERGRHSDGKDNVCIAIEQWVSRPPDIAKRRARVVRMAQLASDLVVGLSERNRGRGGGRARSGGDGAENDVIVLRLADEAREAIHRIHVAFFAAARQGPQDAPAVLREDLARVLFGGAESIEEISPGRNDTEGSPSLASENNRARAWINDCSATGTDLSPIAVADARDPEDRDDQRRVARTVNEVVSGEISLSTRRMSTGRCPPPAMLSSVEAFADFYRLVVLADAMELAACAGDSGLAYGSLHEASTALLPSGCPLCRAHRNAPLAPGRDEDVETAKRSTSTTTATVPGDADSVDVSTPHCDICELSANVVMRGVALMEREKAYDNVFHYLDILLQASSQRLSVHRPRYWLRLVTDLGHKKRAMEALRACETAIAEACPPFPPQRAVYAASATVLSSTKTKHRSTSSASDNAEGDDPDQRASAKIAIDTRTVRSPSDVDAPRVLTTAGAMTEFATQAAAVLPLCESLPLLRRAVRLAVPPLRWRKRPPPDLWEARLRVLRLDLSWRRRGSVGGTNDNGSNGSAYLVPRKERQKSGSGAAAREERRRQMETGEEPEEYNSGVELDEDGVDGRGGREGSEQERVDGDAGMAESTIATGTSLEDAVLDTMLAELGPDWTGLHSENSICLGLFALLCWDALFTPAVPLDPAAGDDTVYRPFRSPFQSEPADLMTTAFAGRRQRILEGVYARVESGGAGVLLRRNWGKHFGKACTGLYWKLFPDGEEGWITVADAIGPLPLSMICRNLASNYWAWRHGLPDLFIWRTDASAWAAADALSEGDGRCKFEARQSVVSASVAGRSERDGCPDTDCQIVSANRNADKVGRRSVGDGAGSVSGRIDETLKVKKQECCQWVEVKGPGDSLSCYQEAWIDTLARAGADAVLLRVEDTSTLR